MLRAANIAIAAAAFLMLAAPLPAQPDAEGVVRASVPASPGNELDAGAARRAIERANADWVRAFQQGDTDGMTSIYTADASLFPPTEEILEGPGEIVGFLDGQRRAGMGAPTLKTADVVTMGNIAYEVGTFGYTFADGGGIADSGKYFAIWKAEGDGRWKYHVGIWTSHRDAAIR